MAQRTDFIVRLTKRKMFKTAFRRRNSKQLQNLFKSLISLPKFHPKYFPHPQVVLLVDFKIREKNPFFLKDTVLLPEYEVGDTADWAIWKCD